MALQTITIGDQTAAADRDAIAARLCRLDFEHFAREFWECVPGAGTVTWGFHMSVICKEMQIIAERVFRGEPALHDCLISISPGSSKSTLASILFHPWTWTRMPSARHLNASHTESLVLDLARKARDVLRSEKYKRYFPEVQLNPEQDARGNYTNTHGGSRYASTVGGKSPLGQHAHFLVGDDLLDPQKVLSEAERETAKDFVANGLPTRVVDKSVSVMFLIMQRLGRGDPAEVMQEIAKRQGARPLRHICLPAELTDKVSPPELRELYTDGLMDPVRLPRHVLDAFRARDAHRYAAQFLQDPQSVSGGMFRLQYFSKRVKAAPFECVRIRYWDRASSIGSSACYTAGVLFARDADGNYYIEDVVHGRWEPHERNQVMRATAIRDRSRYGPRYEPIIYVEAEGGSSGRDAWMGVVKALAGFNVREDRPTGSKDTRAEPLSCQFAAGNVWLVDDERGSWDIDGYVNELLMFKPEPGKRIGGYADRVDATSGAFNIMTKMNPQTPLRVFNLVARKKKKTVRFVVCSRDELHAVAAEEQPSLLVYFTDPAPRGHELVKPDGLGKLMDATVIRFADIDPKDFQDDWDAPLPDYGAPPADLVMCKESGKKLWSFILRQRGAQPEVVVFCDDGDGRAYAAACGVCDTLRLKRGETIWLPGKDAFAADEPRNTHVVNVVRATRCEVL